MSLPPPIPIPNEDWLRKANQRYRAQDIPPAQRPFSALREWAAEHGTVAQHLFLLYLDSEASRKIDKFFRENTKLGQERQQPLSRSVWFYDGSFYQMNLSVILGGRGPSTHVNAFEYIAKSMPSSVIKDFARDEPQVQRYLDHMANALDSLACVNGVVKGLKESFARAFLTSAEQHLDSTVANLLDTPPNPLAAHLARLAFESSLKALLAEKAGLSEAEAKRINHHLDKLVERIVLQFACIIPAQDLTRLNYAADDSISAVHFRRIFPVFGARYDGATLPNRRLWECYASAEHAFATALRLLGASDSRQLNKSGP